LIQKLAEGVWMLVVDDLGDATVERAGALLACEHAAARQVRPELPAGFGTAEVCAAALQRLRDSGYDGLVATEDGRTVAVMTATVRRHPAGGQYASLRAEGFAVEPDLADPTGVLAVTFGDLVSPLIARGVLRYYLVHAALPRLSEALSNLGFGRSGAYGIQPAAARRRSSAVAVRIARAEQLETVARLALVEIQQPYIGPTVTLPGARGKGVGRALVDAALTWAYDHGYRWVSVDFDTANPLSRPFWLNAGFRPAGYGVLRLIDGGALGRPAMQHHPPTAAKN
jgi:GNAT superfamily N-acetyltransferase